MVLIKSGETVTDTWQFLPDDAPAPEGADVIVSLQRWRTERDALLARDGRLGIRLRPDEPPRLVADDLHHFALVALEFPVFKDGRAYSHARVLRERYGFRGELRAVGEVLRDQLLFMARCGVDAFEVADGFAPEAWREALAEISVFYQGMGDGRRMVWQLRHEARPAAE